jgi:hypothetical protein
MGASATIVAAAPAQHAPAPAFNPIIGGPPPVALPANCPGFLSTDPGWTLNFTGGNAVGYGTVNKNGEWGGGNAEGPAELVTSDGTVQYSGHAHIWFGGGNNSGNQTEQGFTLDFNGSGIAGNIDIHANTQQTTNNAGTPTANQQNINVTCS